MAGATLNDLISTIETATALGADIPAPVGTDTWLVRIPEREGKGARATKPLGIFQTREAALAALAAHAIHVWQTSYIPQTRAPWYQYELGNAERLNQWLAGRPDVEICEMYAHLLDKKDDCDYPSDLNFYVLPLEVSASPSEG